MQIKKIKNLKAAFQMFNNIQRHPGKGDITYMELQVTEQHLNIPIFNQSRHSWLVDS